jgi:hypothetical protein
VRFTGPQKFVSMTFRAASSGMVSVSPRIPYPALLTRTSICLKVERPEERAAEIEDAEVTSRASVRTRSDLGMYARDEVLRAVAMME